MAKHKHHELVIPTGSVNISSPSFHLWAQHYYKCVQDFKPPDGGFSPIPYALLCRAIELELKSQHLEKAHLPDGDRQPEVKKKFRHDISKAYRELPDPQKILNIAELQILDQASTIYDKEKGFDYIAVSDIGRGYSRFPNLDALDAVARKLLKWSTQ